MLLGKHEDFIFEGVKASGKPVKKLVLNSDARKSQAAFGMHKEHHKSLTKYVFIGVVILLVVSIVGFNYKNGNFKELTTKSALQNQVSNILPVTSQSANAQEEARIKAETESFERTQKDYQQKLEELKKVQTKAEAESDAITKTQEEYKAKVAALEKAEANK